ncbi:hypothetical protein WA026_003731 [Henosepilachna vigintioctopunctata]
MKLEILDILPEILPDNRYNQAAKQLVSILNTDNSPTAAIIDCLSALNLDEDVRTEIQDVILLRILPTRLNDFPVLMEFLLGSKGRNSSLMFKIRDALDSAMSSNCYSEKESTKVLIYTKLKLFVVTRKQFVQDCLDMINVIKVTDDHKPIDLFLLFLLHSTARNKKRIVELIFRKKVKDGIFRYELLEKLFTKYMPQQIFKDRFNSILEIGCNLIRTSEEPTVKLFSENLFMLLFAHDYSEGIYRKEILDNLLLLAGGNEKNFIHQVLNILLILIKKHQEIFKPHTVIMMRLLEKMDSYDLDAIKLVFEILCSLTCSTENDESMMSMKDEVHMIIRKQLSSSKKHIKFRGVVGAVVMAKYIAETENVDESEVEVVKSIEKLPEGKARSAAKLINMTNNCVTGSYECIGLFYDQLALMLHAVKNLDKSFLSWLSEVIMQDFLDIFILEDFENAKFNDITYLPQYCLNSSDEMYAPIKVNIGLLTVKPQECNKSSVLILASHFRLMRLLLHKQNNGDLSSINSLLGCAIILPEVGDVEDLDQDQLKQVSDCVFHCINWFRELISAFIFHKTLRSKLLRRLHQLIDFEKQLNSYLSRMPEHVLPQSYFYSLSQNKQIQNDAKKKQPPFKKPKLKETSHDDTAASTSVLTVKEKKRNVSTSMKSVQEGTVKYREIDTDYLELLNMKLKFNSNDSDYLNVSTLNFILKDLVKKIHTIFLGKKVYSSPLNVIKPKVFVKDLIRIFPYIKRIFSSVKIKIDELLENNDGVEDCAELLTDESQELKMCFSHILECYSVILSWPDLRQTKNLELLREILSTLRTEDGHVSSISFLVSELSNGFSEYVNQCLLISQGVFLVQILKSLNSFSPNDKRKNKIENTCKELLSKRWYNEIGSLDSGKKFFESINYLVNSYLESMKVAQVNELISNVLIECENLKTKDDYLTILSSIDFKNFHIFYKALCVALHNGVKSEVQSLTNKGHLKLWKNTTTAMSNLKMIARTMSNRYQLSTFLKKSIAVLKIFISHGMPIFEITFSSHKDEIAEILKAMQISTRFLHQLCCDSKLKKNVSLVPHIPHFRLMLEQLIYKVKALLVSNNYSSAFFMGNLKNKDIEGNTQLSDVTEDDSNVGADDEDEEMPSDYDEEIEQDIQLDENKSDSDVFD